MIARCWGIVQTIAKEENERQIVKVKCGESIHTAINYPVLTGKATEGMVALINVTATKLGLGTGGFDYVMALHKDEVENSLTDAHIIKLRYTPMQSTVFAVEAQESQYHRELLDVHSLSGLPVVCAELHSMVPLIAFAARSASLAQNIPLNIVYIMTDGAALPAMFSNLIPLMKSEGIVQSVITYGQAFGGDYEAINIYSALQIANQILKADIVVVAQGPGNAGTGTPLGFSGIDQAVALNAVSALGGTPIAALRMSSGDSRDRHLGVSHHSLTVLNRIVLKDVVVPIPSLSAEESDYVLPSLQLISPGHHLVYPEAELQEYDKLVSQLSFDVSTMGRGYKQDPLFFKSALSAGFAASKIRMQRLHLENSL